MSLTPEQQTKLDKYRRAILPKYYNSKDQLTYFIPSGTQDSLILLRAESKKKAVDYLKKLADAEPSQRTKDYNELLGEVVNGQVTNADNASNDLKQITGKFTDFLNTFKAGQATAANIIIQNGLQPMFDAMVRRLGTIADVEQNITFHRNYSRFMQAQYQQDINAELKKELRSWVRVLVSYPF